MADFAENKVGLNDLDVRVIALSTDDAAGAETVVKKLNLEFPVLYGLDAGATSRLIGCYTGTHEGKPHVQPASFVLDPRGYLIHAVYSSGMVGRLTAEDTLTTAREAQKQREIAET